MNQEISAETLLEITAEEELLDIKRCKNLIGQIFAERRYDLLDAALRKVTHAFYLSSVEFRASLVSYLLEQSKGLNEREIKRLLDNSVIGNLTLIRYLQSRHPVVDSNGLNALDILSEAKYIKDATVLTLYPFEEKLKTDIEEEVTGIYDQTTLKKLTEIYEVLFLFNLVQHNRSCVQSLVNLYASIQTPEFRLKNGIVSSILEPKLDIFIAHMSKFIVNIKEETDIIENYDLIFDSLRNIGIPVFFDIMKVRFNDMVFNDNFYFLLFQDLESAKVLIPPYKQAKAEHVQKIYDPIVGKFVTPKGKYGKILIEDIFSFSEYEKVHDITEEELNTVREMRETEIEAKIRNILKDENRTADSPTEKADIITLKLRINNKDDLRNAAFILKGKSYRKVTINSVATNLLKATELLVDVVFLVYTGELLDEPLTYFIKLCNQNKKMYCVIDGRDLTRLLKAYRLL